MAAALESQRLTNETSMRAQPRRYANAAAMIAALTPSYPVFCLRPHLARQAARLFLDRFPGRVLYAVKCNPHPGVLQAFYDEGVRHFDTASLPEIALVREMFRDAECYFMHPIKGRAAIRAADQVYNVEHYVVDSMDELKKVFEETNQDAPTIFVRLAIPGAGATYDFSTKFGARPAEAVELLKAVKAEGAHAAICFHVGSQCTNPKAYGTALKLVGDVLEGAKVDIDYLDIGGGFPAEYVGMEVPPFEDFMAEIETGVANLRLRRDCVLMCEPGRALAARSMSLVVQVHLRKGDALYINDGVYGSFNEVATGRMRSRAHALRLKGNLSSDLMDFTIFGPTCDSVDVLPVSVRLPVDIAEGDWIEFAHMGAYSNAIATKFNGFHPDTFVQVEDDPPLGN